MPIWEIDANGGNSSGFYRIMERLTRDGQSANILLEEESVHETARLREALYRAGLEASAEEARVQVSLTGLALAEVLVRHGYREGELDQNTQSAFEEVLLEMNDREIVWRRLGGE